MKDFSTAKVYITDYIDDPDIEKSVLKDDLSEDLHEKVEVLLVWHEKITQNFIERSPNLKGIVRYGVGFDNVDCDYAKSKGIYVCNTPDYGTEEVCDTAIAMIMNIVRGITRYDHQCRGYSDSWQEHTISTIKRTSDYHLGVIGAGRIGGSIILRANGLRIQTFFYDPYKPRGHEKMLGAQRFDHLQELLEISDIVSVNTPLTEETRGWVDGAFVAKMKKGSSFVNTARGKIVKHLDVFYQPLKDGHLANVALDVLPEEPPKDSLLVRAWKERVFPFF